MRIVVLVVAVLLSLGSARRAPVTESYDRFTKTKRIGVRDITVGDNLIMSASTGEGSAAVFLYFRTVIATSRWQYLKCHNVDLLADGEPVRVLETKHDGTTGVGYRGAEVTETVIARVNLYDFQRWAEAEAVEGRVCDGEFMITGQDLVNLKNFAARL